MESVVHAGMVAYHAIRSSNVFARDRSSSTGTATESIDSTTLPLCHTS
jgi:hypothetical protein